MLKAKPKGIPIVLFCAFLLGMVSSVALANPAHHQGSAVQSSQTDAPVPAPAPTPPPSQIALTIDGGAGSPSTGANPAVAGETAVGDLASLGITLDQEAKQPSLYDLMMRIMNLMQPHMKEMMGGVPAPDTSAAPNLVVDLSAPMGVKSASKATPESGGSGSLIVQPDGTKVDPVSANMGGMGATAPTATPPVVTDEVKRLAAEIEALKKQVASLLEIVREHSEEPAVSAPTAK